MSVLKIADGFMPVSRFTVFQTRMNTGLTS